jgi:hypothetical protein
MLTHFAHFWEETRNSHRTFARKSAGDAYFEDKAGNGRIILTRIRCSMGAG